MRLKSKKAGIMTKQVKVLTTVYISITTKEVATHREVIKNQIYADFDESGRLVGFEFLNPLTVKIDGVKHELW